MLGVAGCVEAHEVLLLLLVHLLFGSLLTQAQS